MIYHQRAFVNEKPTRKKLLQKSTKKKAYSDRVHVVLKPFAIFLRYSSPLRLWMGFNTEWMEIFLPDTLFLRNVFIFRRAKKRSVIAGSARNNNIQFHSAESQQRWQAALCWYKTILVYFTSGGGRGLCFISQAHLVYVVKAMISGVSHNCTLSLLWNSKLLQGNCGSSRHEV